MTCCTNSTRSESRYYFKGIVYQGSTEQDTVASSLSLSNGKGVAAPEYRNILTLHIKLASQHSGYEY